MPLKKKTGYTTMKEFERLDFGRRTQSYIKRAKTVRRFEDGIELFQDYFTDSDESDTSTSVSESKLNDIPEKPEGLAPESNSGNIKNRGSSKNKTSLSEKSVNVPDSDDVVSSPLTRSKHKTCYQKINSPRTRHYLQTKKGNVIQPSTKFKHNSVKKRLVDDFTQFPENVSPNQTSHHGEKSLSNSDSDSEKSSQDLATSLTRSKHTVYDQQFNTPSTKHNLSSKKHTAMKLDTKSKRKTVGKYPVDNFTECPVTISTQCQSSDGEKSMLTSNAEKSVQVSSVDVDHCLSVSDHNLNANPVQSVRRLSYNKEKSLDLISAKELKMHRKVKGLSKSNVNSRKSVTVTQSTAVSCESPVQSPENFRFRKKKHAAVIKSATEDENFNKNRSRFKKADKFKSKIPFAKGTNSYHITTKDFSSDKISENVENTDILETVVNNEITLQKNMQSSLNKNLKRKKQMNAKVTRVSPRIAARNNNSDSLIDSNEGDELPNKKLQVIKKTNKRINKNLSHMKKQQRKSYAARYSALHPSHLVDASVSELPSQKENLHNSKINDKNTNKNFQSQRSKTKHRYISRSGRVQYPPVAYWKNERIRFQKDGNISVLGVEKCENKQMKNKGKKTLSKTKSVKASVRTHELNSEVENKELTKITIIDVSTGKEREADIIRPFSSLEWDYPEHDDPDYDDYIVTKSFECPNSTWGFICIKPHRKKPLQYTPDEDIYFNVIKGKVEVELHTSKFILQKGGSFFVPRSNYYGITNVHKSKSIL
ncbi:Centromere protein C 1, partial [Stegodyphus mimosarum]